MTKTARDLRSAAHALRTAANALDETVTALRALSDDLNEPDPEPTPAWPTAPHVWWDGGVWALYDDGEYLISGDYWHESHLDNPISFIRDEARRFAREAEPVRLITENAWEAWLNALPDPANDADDDLVQAVDSLAQEVAR